MRERGVLYHTLLASGFLSQTTSASSIDPANSTKQWHFTEIPSSKELIWYPCYTNLSCAVLDVPLDYLKPDQARSYIPIVKLPAATTPYQGMLLTNPGGPGESGIEFLQNSISGLELGNLIPLGYDVVSWDPRGVGAALPVANCNLSSIIAAPAMKRRALNHIYGPEASAEWFNQTYAMISQIGRECSRSVGGSDDAGPHMSTSTVAKDMISIVDAYARSDEGMKGEGNASLLNYWGFSYGTFIGQTFASMYPDRVGRIVLDGVMDADDYVSGIGLPWIASTDEAFSTFFVYCSLAGDQCTFNTAGATADELYLRFESFVNKFNSTLAYQQNWANASLMDLVLQPFKQIVGKALLAPIQNFAAISNYLSLAESLSSDLTEQALEEAAQLAGLSALNGTASLQASDLWEYAILCPDKGGKNYGLKLQDFAGDISKLEAESWLSGETLVQQLLYCAVWDIQTDDRYTGPFGGKTKNPILFVSNTLDPVTPMINGQKAAGIFEDAQLLTIDAVGHCSSYAANACANAKIFTFFLNGTLPGKDNLCPLEAGPWNITLPGPLTKRSEVLEIRGRMRNLSGW